MQIGDVTVTHPQTVIMDLPRRAKTSDDIPSGLVNQDDLSAAKFDTCVPLHSLDDFGLEERAAARPPVIDCVGSVIASNADCQRDRGANSRHEKS